jgi:transcriptional regulator with XRE-family HTH domain
MPKALLRVILMSTSRLKTVIKRLRTERGLTQVKLAKKARVTQTYVAKIEGGDRGNPSLPVLKRLARALGVPVTALLE